MTLRANGRADITAALNVDSCAQIGVTKSKTDVGVAFESWLAICIG